jgi:hypothetical protein
MAELFRVTAPLMIRCPDGVPHVMAELFRHPRGLLYFELYWDRLPAAQGIHLVEGEIRGEGPWKAGDCVISVLGCQGTHPELAGEFAGWRAYLEECGDAFPSREQIESLARDHGAVIDSPRN